MKTLVVIIVVAAVVASAAFGITYHLRRDTRTDELAWMRQEFQLTPEQTAKIAAYRAAYAPVCAGHCRRIGEARTELSSLIRDRKKDSPEYTEALAKWNRLCAECTQATERHVEAVADCMSPEQGQRFRALIEPKLTHRNPGVPFDLH